MIFNMSIRFVDSNQFNLNKLALLKFFRDDNKLKLELLEFLKINQINFNRNLVDNFINNEEVSEIKFYDYKSNPDMILLKKVKADKKFNADFFRSEVAAVLLNLKNQDLENLQIDIPAFELFEAKFNDKLHYYSSFVDGLYLGNYSFTRKSKKQNIRPLKIFLHSNKFSLSKTQSISIKNIFNAVYASRDLVNEPANIIHPKSFIEKIKKLFALTPVSLQIYDEKKLINMGMGALLAVGGGSNNSPYLAVLHYKPEKKVIKKVALVGKGVTYDSGGLSIKPTSGMIDMKADMAGAATVIGTVYASAKNNLSIEIFGVIPLAENMVSGKSYKPGDIIKSYSGKTIEIKDTDAEGRLILADAITYACNLKPDLIIDYATLTGACVVALGEIAAGLFSNDELLASSLIEAGKLTHERIWQLPMWQDYDSMFESKIADISNLGPRWGGAITAAKFLEYFVDEKIPWAHLDIAGPALKHKENSYSEDYDTGFGVRLTYKFLEKIIG